MTLNHSTGNMGKNHSAGNQLVQLQKLKQFDNTIFIFIFTILAWFSLTQQFDAFHEVLVTEVVVYLGSNYFYLWIVWTDKSSVPQPQHCTKFLVFLEGTSKVQISLPQLSNFLKENKNIALNYKAQRFIEYLENPSSHDFKSFSW